MAFKEMSQPEIDHLLDVERVMRVGFEAHGERYLVPLGFVWHQDALYAMTTRGRKTPSLNQVRRFEERMNTIADKADLIFTGGRVHTMDVGDRFVEAVAIADNRIVAVGSDRDVLALKQRATRVVELRGRSLLPGFIDAHCHVAFLGSFLAGINCKAPGFWLQGMLARFKGVIDCGRHAAHP